jgi:hypothetical protein
MMLRICLFINLSATRLAAFFKNALFFFAKRGLSDPQAPKIGNGLAGAFEKAGFDVDIEHTARPAMFDG